MSQGDMLTYKKLKQKKISIFFFNVIVDILIIDTEASNLFYFSLYEKRGNKNNCSFLL